MRKFFQKLRPPQDESTKVKKSAGKDLLIPALALLTVLILGIAMHGLWKTTSLSTAISRSLWDNFQAKEIALSLNETDAELAFQIGNANFGLTNYDLALAKRAFEKTIAIDPNFPGAHYQLARVYFIRSNFTRAAEEINREIELYPDFKRSHYVRGLIYGYSGRLKEAEAEFKEFLKWSPDSWAGNNDLAWIYFAQGNYGGARDAARAGLEIAPDNPWLLNSLGVALLNLDDRAGAKEALQKALSIVDVMDESAWGRAYPGNDPEVYEEGFAQMKESIKENLALLEDVDISKPSPLW